MTNGRRFLVLGSLLLGMLMHSPAAERYSPGTLIVKLAPASTSAALSAEIRQVVSSLQKSDTALFTLRPLLPERRKPLWKNPVRSGFDADRYLVLHCASASDADAAYAHLQQSRTVEFVQRSWIYRIDALPNDSATAAQWNLRRIGVVRLWNEGFFALQRPLVKVGVLDTGIDYLHPDLAPAIAVNDGETGTDAMGHDKRSNGADDDGNGYADDWRGYNFVGNDGRGNDPADDNGHGTGVAGIIGAVANNVRGIAGIAPCALLPIRAFDADGNGADEDIAAAIVYAVENGCGIINMSFGVTVLTPIMRDAVRYASSMNVTLIASSGNDGNEKAHYPSDIDGVIAVGSVSQYESRSYFSSYGPPLALSAPGENIPTTAPGGGYTESFSGTSAAAPHVTAVAALVKSVLAADPARTAPAFTNNEMRTLLANTADDIGKPGWEMETGAGVVDAYKAVRALTQNLVAVSSPAADAVLTGGNVPVMGTAVFSGMSTLTVSVGQGEKPDAWTTLASYENRYFFGDTVALWNTGNVPDGIYIIRLAAASVAGSDVEYRVRVLVKRTPPIVISFVTDDSVLIGDEFGALVRVDADRPTSASLLFRPKGSNEAFVEKRSEGVQKHHYFLLTSNDAPSGIVYELYCRITDNAGQTVYTPAQYRDAGALPSVAIGQDRIPTTGFRELPYTLPAGFLLNAVATFRSKPLVIMNRYDENNGFGSLNAFQFSGNAFAPADSLQRQWVPRDLADANGDGVVTSLVQDRGITKVIGSDESANKMFARDIFGDSTDVWGSRFFDIDRDGKMDIIARSSTEYLVYKNLGGGRFQPAAHLADPTDPLPGEAKNQFGPPNALAGDFTGAGRTEIAFADHDGDVVLYRQSASDPFSFSLAWSDTSSLYETSEFLAAGDFDGDGVTDIASAGHTNTDLNADREYDAPVWTVRIFSHAGHAGAMRKVWEKKVVGVHSGFRNDNGLSAGRVMPGTEQLLMSLNPYFYIIRYDSIAGTFDPVWIRNGQTNAALIHDFNRNGTNEFGIHTDAGVRFYEHETGALSLQAPWGVIAEQAAERSIRLRWNSMSPGSDHAVYRDTVPGRYSTRIIVRGTAYTDTAVVPGTNYFYAVAMLNPNEGSRSETAVVHAEHNPRIASAEAVSSSQVRLTMSTEIDRSRFPLSFITADDTIAAQSIVEATPASVVVTFPGTLAPGGHMMRIKRIYALSGLENDTTQRVPFTIPERSVVHFGLVEAKREGEKTVRLRFSSAVAASSLKRSNFTMRTSASVFQIAEPAADPSDSAVVILRVEGPASLTALGLRVEVTVSSGVLSSAGDPLNDGKGQTISFGINALSLAHPVVFPNPLRYLTGLQEKITFVNIPVRCKVSIFTSAGSKVRVQDDLSTADGLTWDLRNDKGEVVPSGIYIYRLLHVDENGSVLESTMGKFAIIR